MECVPLVLLLCGVTKGEHDLGPHPAIAGVFLLGRGADCFLNHGGTYDALLRSGEAEKKARSCEGELSDNVVCLGFSDVLWPQDCSFSQYVLITQFTPSVGPFLNDLTVQGVCAGGARCAGGAKCDRACGCSAMHSRNSCPRKCAST